MHHKNLSEGNIVIKLLIITNNMLTGRNQNWICKAFLRLAELTTQKKKDSLILTEDLFILTKSHKINRDKTKNKRN